MALLGASSAHAEASRKVFAELELTEGQPKILYILEKQTVPIVQKELAELCRIRQSTLTVLLSKLEKKNLIYKEPCRVSNGKKAYCIYLTETGRVMAEQLEKAVEALEEIGFYNFTKTEKEQLLEMLSRIEKNIKSNGILEKTGN